MRWRYILRILGALVFSVGLSMLFPIVFSLYYQDGSWRPLVTSTGLTLGVGAALFLSFRGEQATTINHREGMVIVTLAWTAIGGFGSLPYYLSGTTEQIIDAFFESFSGFTTTGASILIDIESVPRGILMWRSLTHWLGGMGIIVLSLAVLPFLGVGGMQLYKAEVPSPVPDKLKPRIKDTAMTLWKVYVLFSLLETALLMFGGMDLFDALCHTFGTMATGGFSTKNASIAHFNSAYIDTVIICFMLLAGINFSLHYQMLRGRPGVMWKDPEFRFFGGIILIFIVASVFSLFRTVYDSVGEALRYSAFQVISIITTTGYATADYEKWTPITQAILLFCMFMGASAGSTGGGMKCMRIMLVLKHSYQELVCLIHPRAVLCTKLGGRVVPTDVMSSIWGFLILYLSSFIVFSLILSAMGIDIVTSFAAVAATIGNIGPGLGGVGPTDNYAHLPATAKGILTFCMLLGRLEIYTVIILVVPEFWRK